MPVLDRDGGGGGGAAGIRLRRLRAIQSGLHHLPAAAAGAGSCRTTPNPDLLVDRGVNLGGWMLPAARRKCFHNAAFGHQGITIRSANVLALSPGARTAGMLV